MRYNQIKKKIHYLKWYNNKLKGTEVVGHTHYTFASMTM